MKKAEELATSFISGLMEKMGVRNAFIPPTALRMLKSTPGLAKRFDLKLRAANGRKTAVRMSGQPTESRDDTAGGRNCADQLVVPNRPRNVVAVAEIGLTSAIAPSQAGMVPGSTNTLDRNATGHTRIWT